jgi:hypothetical protein
VRYSRRGMQGAARYRNAPTGTPRALCAEAEKAQAVVAFLRARSAESWAMPALTRQQKITLGEMRGSGARGVLVYCSDYRCSHSTAISADRWADHVRLSDIEPRFTCQACADVRPGFGQCLYVKRTGRHRGRPGYSGACVRRSRYRRCPTEATTQRAKSPTPIQTRSETISNSFA